MKLINSEMALQSPLSFFDSVLRGIGQVMLQNNSYTGFIFLIGIFYHSILSGFAVLIGTVASTATAVVYAAMSAALEPLGMPALTAPFVFVVWLFLLASPRFLRISSVINHTH